MGDAVSHPDHYNSHPAGIECVDVIEHMTFNVGSAIKYLWRAGLKDKTPVLQDLHKAEWYINREIRRLTAGQEAAAPEGGIPMASGGTKIVFTEGPGNPAFMDGIRNDLSRVMKP